MASWKAFERAIAAQLGTTRIPILGREGADIAINGLWIDCKKRKSVPRQWEAVLSAAETLGYTSVQVEDVIVTRMAAFNATWHQTIQAHVTLTQLPLTWLDHISESAPDGALPMVIMVRPNTAYKNAIVLYRETDFEGWYDRHARNREPYQGTS